MEIRKMNYTNPKGVSIVFRMNQLVFFKDFKAFMELYFGGIQCSMEKEAYSGDKEGMKEKAVLFLYGELASVDFVKAKLWEWCRSKEYQTPFTYNDIYFGERFVCNLEADKLKAVTLLAFSDYLKLYYPTEVTLDIPAYDRDGNKLKGYCRLMLKNDKGVDSAEVLCLLLKFRESYFTPIKADETPSISEQLAAFYEAEVGFVAEIDAIWKGLQKVGEKVLEHNVDFVDFWEKEFGEQKKVLLQIGKKVVVIKRPKKKGVVCSFKTPLREEFKEVELY